MLSDPGSDDGVSPVVGVILVVAITVALATTIGFFVFDLGESLSGSSATTSSEALSITETTAGTYEVQLISSPTADEIQVSVSSDPNGYVSLTDAGDTVTATVPDGDTLSVISVTGDEKSVVYADTADESSGVVTASLSTSGSGASLSDQAVASLVWESDTDWDAATDESGLVTHTAGSVSLDGTSDDAGLVGHWTFDGTYADASGNGNGLSGSGTSFTSDAPYGQGLVFDGEGDYASGPVIETGTRSEWTLTFWLKGNEEKSGAVFNLGGKDGGSSSQYGLLASHGHSGWVSDSLSLYYGNGTKDTWYATEGRDDTPQSRSGETLGLTYPNTQYHHYAMTFDNGNLTYYLDGEQIANVQKEMETVNFDGSTPLYLGREKSSYGGLAYLNGSLDDVRYYHRAVPGNEIADQSDALRYGRLTTASQTFENPIKPSLQNLEYTEPSNTEIIFVVTGSPGTSNEETVIQTADGASDYDLSSQWSQTHTTVAVEVHLRSTTPGDTPTVSRIELDN